MRVSLILLPLALAATPATAQAPQVPEKIEIPAELTDPAVTDRVVDMMQILSKALLNLPVGGMKAAVEGRRATEHDKGLTVRDLGRRDNPQFERRLERQIAQSKPMMRQSMKALADALPAMMKGMAEAGEAVERAAANMPQPGYPNR